MAPFLLAAIPALIEALPDFARMFQNKDVAERNVEAVVKATDIIMQSVGATNVQEAVEKVQADPEVAAAANDALRLNTADLMDMFERMAKMDEASVATAREFATTDAPVWHQWHYVHLLSTLLVLLGGIVAVMVIFYSDDATERAMALQTLLLVGFVSVVGFWLGSSRSSQMKDLLKDRS